MQEPETVPDIFSRAKEAAQFILSHAPHRPSLGVVLGSGFAGFGDRLENAVHISYLEIPFFPRPTVAGHRGELLIGSLGSIALAVLSGRLHGYEGYSPEQTTFPMRVLRLCGISTVILTNAAGGIRSGLQTGQLALISDHINFTGRNPLAGLHEPRFGERFPDMTEIYSSRLRSLAQQAALAEGLPLQAGVYVGILGPSFETPAEIRTFRGWGADLVGMSTVHEAIVARQMSMEVLAFSCVTNMAAGLTQGLINHEEVMEIGRRVEGQFARIMLRLVPLLQAIQP